LQVLTTTDNNSGSFSYGKVLTSVLKSGSTTLRTITYTYVAPLGVGVQLDTMTTADELGNTSKVSYTYGSYGRIASMAEYGFANTLVRTTNYTYTDDPNYIGLNMLRLLVRITVSDSSGSNVSKATFTYDDYAAKGGMEYYGLTATSSYYPPAHNTNFDQTNLIRGNVTGVKTWTNMATGATVTRNSKYDIFGNIVQADVSCCQVKTYSFGTTSGSATYYSQPDSVTDGTPGVAPFLTTSYVYDFNTGLPKQMTDPNNLTTSYLYDAAWRVNRVNAPSGAYTISGPDRDSNGNDQLAASRQVTFTENGVSKTLTSKNWFDGSGHVLRSGSGAGSAPTSFDTVATVYEAMGRVYKQSNPYSGDASGNGSPSYWTTDTYDALSRVTQVKLPDNQLITTAYSGATVTVTDPVNRQRKSQMDGLGRLISVTEQDPTTGGLSVGTNYSYDPLDNLTQVNQGGQLRTFVYDALSRVTSQTIPEAGTETFTYWDSGQAQKHTDARGVETHYGYDALNRLNKMWYTGTGGDDAGSVRPALPATVAATADVQIIYNNYTAGQIGTLYGNGQVASISDQAGSESYSYDNLNRQVSKTRTLDSRSYTTQYLYTTANQLTTLVYPSGKRVRMNHDSRGRMSGVDKVDSVGNLLGTYLSGVSYRTEGMVSGLTLGNGVAESYGYSADRLQMTSQTATKGASTLLSLSYSYAAVAGASGVSTVAGNSGQLMSITGAVNSQTRNQGFTYDNVGRLATASGWSVWGRRYGYDRFGNRTGMWDATSGGNQLQNIAIATTSSVPNNRIANVNGVSYTYDASGKVTADGGHSYTYDGEGRLATVDSGATATNVYDGENRRVKNDRRRGGDALRVRGQSGDC
jgi:RHS Repeat.